MGLKIVCESEKYPFLEVEKAVFETLEQKDDLEIEILFVSLSEIREINLEQRNIDKETDCLSFPTLDGIRGKILDKKEYPLDRNEEGDRLFLGSVVVCEDKAKMQAEEYGHSLKREVYYLSVHGILHLFGYDHMLDSEKAQMRAKEEEIMNKINLRRE